MGEDRVVTDYGQDLQFGTFLTPDAGAPDRVVELALLTETAGLDLATIQDHPYQARFLDAWALIATIAARTSTLRLTTNVTNLPLRPPFVLAKTVASLDLLSRGRIELGLGAGAFWDAVVAAGGPRRTPKEAVAALAEGIEIIRATWDTSRRSVRLDGEHYRAAGVHPGPAPAHDVEIWIGAIGPKMLALTGRVGDGWLPSQAYVPADQLAEKNSRIDDAALAAGREPAQIRRLYNVNPSSDAAWAESLVELAVVHGVSTFIVAGDDPRTVQEFGTEIAPAVRELVARERGRGDAGSTGSAATTAPEQAAAEPVDQPSGHGPRGRAEQQRPTESVAIGSTVLPENAPRPTIDDGVRRSDRLPWDDASRPTYAWSGTPLAWTAHERASGQHLIDVHDHLRSELRQLFDLIEQVAAGTLEAGRARSLINTMTLRQNDWTLGAYCQSYCRLVTTHHSIEDSSMFPHLRSADDALAPVIDRLESEHHVIAGVLDEVDRGLVAVVSGPDGMAELRRAVDLLSDTMTSHLSYEERELVEPLARFGFY
jgi:alkanesulfonate monooxygenase SsuD/methylene tetrahydromethanopterin reductase-like flavin-dependent oxidoreductase (luciferase family)